MRKLIVIQNRAEGLGELLKEGAEAIFAQEPAGEHPSKKKKVILITPEGSSDTSEKKVADVLGDPLVNEEDKPGKKDRHLKQVFKRALGGAADVVIVDNGFSEIIPEEIAREEAKTFEYEIVQFISITQYFPFEKNEKLEPKSIRGVFPFLNKKRP